MQVEEFAKTILDSGKLEDKLAHPTEIRFREPWNAGEVDGNRLPARDRKISFSEKRVKFPKRGSLGSEENRAKTLHFFANHELLAIEVMAYAIIKFQHNPIIQKKIYSTILDEQKHFKLYQKRMNELGVEFGDFPLNDFFWRQVPSLKTEANYISSMSLCFEMANLDFASEYQEIFQEYDDMKSSKIMGVVLEDEITHVAVGWNYCVSQDKDVWNYFLQHLPRPLTPQRSKGVLFNREARQKAGLSDRFIEKLMNYSDEFRITNRKQWKS